MKYLIPLLILILAVAFVWDRQFTKLRLEKCAKSNAQVVIVYGKARSCPQGGLSHE
ncbi:hypothetical protein OIN82_18105 [Acinetobacter baumannii]|nr:hypothetical protein [Acinetobacter baumannii]